MSQADSDGAKGVLAGVLLAAREAGFLGPGPIDRHLCHARGFVDLGKKQPQPNVNEAPHILDLGSGGGLPGLVVADQWPEATLVLLEANRRRADFLHRAVVSCGFQDRVSVVQQRAEVCGRDLSYRGTFDGVVVRSFGVPAVVAECAAPFLRKGGWLIVSEPPAEESPGFLPQQVNEDSCEEDHNHNVPHRWPSGPLAQFGLMPLEFVRTEFGYQLLCQREPCPERFPRRDGVPSRKPLF